MKRRSPRAPAAQTARPAAAPARAPAPVEAPPGERDPAAILAALVALACILAIATFQITDTEFWQHLLLGRVLWEGHALPATHQWSWLAYGTLEMPRAWVFAALLWPFHDFGGITGLFAWRWITTLVVFALLWATARRLGARGPATWVILVWSALLYRGYAQVRPETLATVLLALTLWVLERRRGARPTGLARDPLLWLIPITWVWVGTHGSWVLVPALIGLHAVVAAWRSGGGRLAALRPFAIVGVAALALACLNPFGPRALWLPFADALRLIREPAFRAMSDIQPLNWDSNLRNGAWLLIGLWPALLLWRARRHGFDAVEALSCLLATAATLPAQPFLGFYAVVAAPFLARDADAFVRSRRGPAWTGAPAVPALLAALACVALAVPEWTRPGVTPGVGVDLRRVPVAAADFMARHGVRGRGFGPSRHAAYQAWRFWPERERLPFLDASGSGRAEDRAALAELYVNPGSWYRLRRRYQFDYALLDRRQGSGGELLNVLDGDTTFALVFIDDGAALYVRRDTAMAAVADSFRFQVLGGGAYRLAAIAARAGRDSLLRAVLRPEIERAVGDSRWNAVALSQLANLDLTERRPDDARRHLEAALAADPQAPAVHKRLGVLALRAGDARAAIVAFEHERRVVWPQNGIELGIGMAHEMARDTARAIASYRRELAIDPGSRGARERLAALGQRP